MSSQSPESPYEKPGSNRELNAQTPPVAGRYGPSSSSGNKSLPFPYESQQNHDIQLPYTAPGVDSQPMPYSASYGSAYKAGYSQVTGFASRPRPHVGFVQAQKNWFKYMFHFSGRASRSEYWWVQLTATLILFVLLAALTVLFVGAVVSTDSSGTITSAGEGALLGVLFIYLLIFMVSFALMIMMLGVGWRRLQDAVFPGWIYLLSFVGLAIIPFILSFFPSTPEGYQYDRPADIDRL